MANKKIPWWMPQVGSPEERRLINLALDNNFVNEGSLTTEFENSIAKLVGSKFAVAVPNCTSAIFLSLKALDIGYGDEVIVPDITFIATANAVRLTGATPILVDIDPTTLTISVEATHQAITARTRAIVPVHVTGRAANMTAINNIAAEFNLTVIEDAAEALLSRYQKKFLGTLGQAGCFSFSPNKTITTGQGGMIVTNSPELHAKLRMLKDHGRPTRGTGGDDIHNTIGYNFKFTDLQAGVGLGQLIYLETRIKRMKKNHELYLENLKNISEIFIFSSAEDEVPQWTDIKTEHRDELEKYLKEKNIDSRKYWLPIHKQLAYKLPDKTFPNSTKMSPQCLWLPSAFTLTDEDVMRVCEEIKKFFHR